jgi:iron(III) transport system substrate-binding protein
MKPQIAALIFLGSVVLTWSTLAAEKVVLYSPENENYVKELVAACQKETGLEVSFQYIGSTGAVFSRIKAEERSPGADVVYGGGGPVSFESHKKYLEPYTPQAIKDWPIFKKKLQLRARNWTWTGFEIFIVGIAYNSKALGGVAHPDSFESLSDTKWKGKLMMPDPTSSGTGTIIVLSQLAYWELVQPGKDAGWKYWDSVYPNLLSLPSSGYGPIKAVAKGEVPAGLGFDFMAFTEKAGGQSVEFVLPKHTAVVSDPVSLVKGGPNPAGGKKFIDWMQASTKASQIAANWYRTPLNMKVPPKHGIKMDTIIDQAVALNLEKMGQDLERVKKEWSRRYR